MSNVGSDDSTGATNRLLWLIVKELTVTNKLLTAQCRLLVEISNKESTMVDKLTQAFADFDQEIGQIGTDISDLVKRLASTPPGVDANAIADQIESRIQALKGVADPLKSVSAAAAPAEPAPTDPTDPTATAPTEPQPAAPSA